MIAVHPVWRLGIAPSLFCALLVCGAAGEEKDPRGFELRVTRARRIYSDGQHNAFTGMARLGDRTFVTFRSAATHMTMDGKIRIIASDDLQRWQSVHVASRAGEDLRDPKLVTFAGRLLCYFAARRAPVPGTKGQGMASMVVGSADGCKFDEPRSVRGVRPGAWLWHVAARGDVLYGAAYGGGQKAATLYRSRDGFDWERVTDFPTPCNETYLEFAPDGVLWALARDGLALCRAQPPYAELAVVKRIDIPHGGPMLKRLPT